MIKLMKLPALALLGSVPIGHVLAAQMNSDSLRQSLRNRGIVSASRSARAPSSEALLRAAKTAPASKLGRVV
jgi:hypothetical protein